MSALKPPAPDASAEEWGRFAVSIPGWRYPDRRECPLRYLGWDDAGARPIPHPDHWPWWGWLIKLLGPERIAVSMWVDQITVGQSHLVMDTSALGRACIAAAAALGRWPGGEG